MVYLLGNDQSTVFIDFIVNHIQMEAGSSSQMVMIWKQAALLKSSCCCFSSILFWATIEGNWELSVTGRCSHVHQGCGGTISLLSPGQEEEPASPKLSCRCFSFLPPSYSDCSVQRINPFPEKKRFLQTGLKPSIKLSISLTEKVYFQPWCLSVS